MTDNIRRHGLDMMEQVYGWPMKDGPGAHFAATADHLFGRIWSRPGLSLRDRRLLLLGVIAAAGLADVASIQMDAALRNTELDENQLREIVLFLAHYVGWPVAADIDAALDKIIDSAEPGLR
ncbi:carboxymuconolactone decarboxylase family protein [Nocardia sp. NPDC004654]|uniref:carboxymuconolactone decarboxylase family protein n=1 Tax=Nocardia sp. NPDC004654 TaxID=3154776 RepID=UPI0033ABAFE5